MKVLGRYLALAVGVALPGCMAVIDDTQKKLQPSGLITTPPSYYSTAKARQLGEKYKENLERLVEQIVRNPRTAHLQFANNIATVGGLGFFTHSATKTPDERYLEVVLTVPETFEKKGDYSEKLQRLFSTYGRELLAILAGDPAIFQDKDVAGYGLNLTWRTVSPGSPGRRVILERAVSYFSKERVGEFLKGRASENLLLAGAVIFAVEENGPMSLVSYRPQEIKPDSRPPIKEENIAEVAQVAEHESAAAKKPEAQAAAVQKAPGGQTEPRQKAPETMAAKEAVPESALPPAAPVSQEGRPSAVKREGTWPSERVEAVPGAATTPEAKKESPETENKVSEPRPVAKSPVEVAKKEIKSAQEVKKDRPQQPTTPTLLEKARPVPKPESSESPKPVAEGRREASREADIAKPKAERPEIKPVQETTARGAAEKPAPAREPAQTSRLPQATAERAQEQAPPRKLETSSDARKKESPAPEPVVALPPKTEMRAEKQQPDRVVQPVPEKPKIQPRSQVAKPAVDVTESDIQERKIQKPEQGSRSEATGVASGEAPKPPVGTSPSPRTKSAESSGSTTVKREQPVPLRPGAPAGSAPVAEPARTPVPVEPSQPVAVGKSSPSPVEAPKRESGREASAAEEKLALLRKPPEPAREPKTPPVKSKPRALEGYVIQIAFADRAAALRWAEKLEQRGHVVSVTAAGDAIRLRVGNFSVREQAERRLRELQQDGLSGIVVNLPQAYRPEAALAVQPAEGSPSR